MSKKKSDKNGFVYSTDPNFQFQPEEGGAQQTLPPQQQKLRVMLEKRGGKPTTVVFGFVGADEDLQELGKKLKGFCGTGGSIKDGEAMIQGDQREKVMGWLLKNGYSGTKKAGG
ncbi:translation initiation factor [Flaviaesturariibacter amylovorans]|uniref:Translation initiation factor Sui1 n=1 Tax=Flaviaesturariibacter amylovorans TaxID=1084520 RepID=A0ABP8GCY9_9BACT